MKVLIIGGVAAGTKVAAKLKREDQSCDVTIITKGEDISYAGCGLPYFVSGAIEHRSELIVNTPDSFNALTGVTVLNNTEATNVDTANKTVTIITPQNAKEVMGYDKLVIAVGAHPLLIPFPGVDLPGVHYMRTPEDAIKLRERVDAGEIHRAVVIGGGFIGLEIAENLAAKDIRVTVIEMAPHVMPGFDESFQEYAENAMSDAGINVFTNDKLVEIIGEGKVEKIKTATRAMKTDAVILSVGIRPSTEFLKDTPVAMNQNGTIIVDDHFKTNIDDIYAVGDCITVTNMITNDVAWSPMGSSANIEGRICAQNIVGGDISYKGVLGTAIVKLTEKLSAARTGLTTEAAIAKGYSVESVTIATDEKAHYYPGAGSIAIKLIADKATHKLLGAQALGTAGVDKVIDICVMALSMDVTIEDLQDLDFAYAPPFSTAIHPLVHTANVLLNKLHGDLVSITPEQWASGEYDNYKIIDVSKSKNVSGAAFFDLNQLIDPAFVGFTREEPVILVCNRGKRAYMAQNKLLKNGFNNTLVLEGGTFINKVKGE